MNSKIPTKDIFVIALLLFALFFGAGNLVFPAMMGQAAGTSIWSANFGFLITGVCLPLLGVIALGFSGKSDLLSLASRVHPLFGILFTTILYLTIGPLFAIPRTGSVSYEIAIKPFISDGAGHAPLLIFTVLYFSLTCIFSLNPAKIIDIVGKVLTPMLILFIGILAITAIVNPIGDFQTPVDSYAVHSFFNGFQEGYLTMDALAAFVFGIIIINAIKERGAQSKKHLLIVCLKTTAISASILAVIYSVIAYIGATSVEKFGYLENGGEVLTRVSNYYFGTFGGIILGAIVLLACLTTSIGLITSCSTYLNKLIPSISYKLFAIILSVVSAAFANVGLTQLIEISVPVLTIIYPLAIMLMLLTFLHPLFKGKKQVYHVSLILTFMISLVDGLADTGLKLPFLHTLFNDYLPMNKIGLGWLLPAFVGAILGWAMPSSRQKI
ncbi:branched-chain amino acid transport system II carrier protein [Paenibacillus sp. FSL H8-0548]|uniref:branched-chain amino acid transport system II carrier protein n=1 Tax=Paenibacillus sp. FSL H8-0548 TaxID=1920422 RepID=UPI00096E88AF|nr:branched-chain amino acid transport system II carrier protein [Paenibacillus sp. FSL H8-0548]OMF19732.1 branched-chain amino acid transport system II carrier protein [Paenibacillus sp. FSL H8-0548]